MPKQTAGITSIENTISLARVTQYPNIPSLIEYNDLGDKKSGLLYDKDIVDYIKTQLAKHSTEKQPLSARYYNKQEMRQLFESSEKGKALLTKLTSEKKPLLNIFRDGNGEIYVVYKGLKHHKALGKGAFGKVKIIQNIETGEFAVLKIQTQNSPDDTQDMVEKRATEEKNILLKQHGSLKKLDTTYVAKKQGKRKNKETKFAFTMPYGGGHSLKTWCIQRTKTLTAHAMLQLAYQAAMAMKNMHDKDIVHCDIKPDNITIDSEGNVHIVDFGLAKETHTEPWGNKVAISSLFAHTPEYVAPELIPKQEAERNNYVVQDKLFTEKQWQQMISQNIGPAIIAGYFSYRYTPASDIYALGKTFKELFGELPIDDTYSLPRLLGKDKKIMQLLNQMTRLNPNERPTIEKIISILEKQLKKYLPITPVECTLLSIEDSQTIIHNKAALNNLKSHDVIYLTQSSIPTQETDKNLEILQQLKAKGLPMSHQVLTGTPEQCYKTALSINQQQMQGALTISPHSGSTNTINDSEVYRHVMLNKTLEHAETTQIVNLLKPLINKHDSIKALHDSLTNNSDHYSYKTLFQALREIDQLILSQHKPHRSISTFFQPSPTHPIKQFIKQKEQEITKKSKETLSTPQPPSLKH